MSLSSYMTLPVEQYFVLDPSMIKPLGGNKFKLQVPPINVFNITLRAVAEIRVTTTSNSVYLETTNCQLFGDSMIESLNDKFCMTFDTRLTWDTPKGNGARVSDTVSNGGVMPITGGGAIQAEGDLNVWCEVIPPFNLLPRPVLEGACNVAIGTMLEQLLPLFVNSLSADYLKWSKDPAYREMRAARSMPLT